MHLWRPRTIVLVAIMAGLCGCGGDRAADRQRAVPPGQRVAEEASAQDGESSRSPAELPAGQAVHPGSGETVVGTVATVDEEPAQGAHGSPAGETHGELSGRARNAGQEAVAGVAAAVGETAAASLLGADDPDGGRIPRQEDGTFLVAGRWSVPAAILGRVPNRSVVENAPGYQPPDDLEADAVLRGRREVGRNDAPLTRGFPTAMALSREILAAVSAGDAARLAALRVTSEEFSEILWPEFPQSRPITNIRAEDAFGSLYRESLEGISRGIQDCDGRQLEFTGLSFASVEDGGGLARYTNFDLLQGVRIHGLTADGDLVVLDFAHTFVVKDGVWKVYIYKD